MNEHIRDISPLLYARLAGVLYLTIIVFGLFTEIYVRSGLIAPGDPAATANNIVASQGLFRLGFFTDSIMLLSDVALAVLLYVLLKPVSMVLSLMAMCFRLVQTAVLALNLLHYYAAALILGGVGYSMPLGPTVRDALALFFLDLHAHGYDLGLLLFGLNCLVLGYLVFKSHFLPKVLGVLMMGAGLAYLIGSYTRFLFPEYIGVITPIYALAVIAEVSICLWLLIKGVNMKHWARMNRAA